MMWFPLGCFLRAFKWKLYSIVEEGILLKHLGLIQTVGHHMYFSGHMWWLWRYATQSSLQKNLLKIHCWLSFFQIYGFRPMQCTFGCSQQMPEKGGVPEVGLYLLTWGPFYQHSLPNVLLGWHLLRAALLLMFLQPTLLYFLSPFIGVRPT